MERNLESVHIEVQIRFLQEAQKRETNLFKTSYTNVSIIFF